MPASPTSPDPKKHLELIQLASKKWDECTDSEKIEKLKMECRDYQYLSNTVSQLKEKIGKLEQHTHADGKVVVPLKDEHNFLTGQASRSNYLA